jgi:hypothetical protein
MSETFNYENLIAGAQKHLVNLPATIILGQNIVRGTLLGKITASGKLKLATVEAVDGSQNPFAIAAEDVDATLADTLSTVYVEGEFNDTGVTFDYDENADDWRAACAAVGIYLRPSVAK